MERSMRKRTWIRAAGEPRAKDRPAEANEQEGVVEMALWTSAGAEAGGLTQPDRKSR